MIIFSGNQSQSYLAIHCLFAMCQQSQHALRLSQTNKRRRKKKALPRFQGFTFSSLAKTFEISA